MAKAYLKSSLLILAFTTLLIPIATAGADIGSQLIRDVIFETKPCYEPYYFHLTLADSYFIDFSLSNDLGTYGQTRYSSDGYCSFGPSIGYFWALNSGELVFINRHNNMIFVLNPETGNYFRLAPTSGMYTKLNYLWVGPDDEIFTGLSGYLNHNVDNNFPNPNSYIPPTFSYKLFRYHNIENGYVLDSKSDFPVFSTIPRLIRISPNNNLYIKLMGKAEIIDKNGWPVKIASAMGQTQDRTEFIIQSGGSSLIEVKDISSGDVIMRDEFTRQIGHNNFKGTFDNNLILYFHSSYEFRTPDSGSVRVDIPFVMGKDLNSGARYSIDLMECARSDYKYFNVSDISLNYLGDIYAIVVYFNDIGRITLDEEIVLYRWRRAD